MFKRKSSFFLVVSFQQSTVASLPINLDSKNFMRITQIEEIFFSGPTHCTSLFTFHIKDPITKYQTCT